MTFEKLLKEGLNGKVLTKKELDKIKFDDNDFWNYGIKDFYDAMETLQSRNIIIID